MNPLVSFRRIETKPVRVKVVMSDGSSHEGDLHVLLDERLQDLLNSEKPFLPLRREHTEEIVLLSKQYIVWAAEVPGPNPAKPRAGMVERAAGG